MAGKKKFSASEAITKLITLVVTELGKKQDAMEEITAEEVQEMWDQAGETITPGE